MFVRGVIFHLLPVLEGFVFPLIVFVLWGYVWCYAVCDFVMISCCEIFLNYLCVKIFCVDCRFLV